MGRLWCFGGMCWGLHRHGLRFGEWLGVDMSGFEATFIESEIRAAIKRVGASLSCWTISAGFTSWRQHESRP
jgi:hypothetical protein